MHIVDRRLNPRGKSLGNRQRFLGRAKALVRQAVHENSAGRSIRDAEQGGEISIPADGLREPTFRRSATGGVRDHILPGNKRFVEGDELPRPPGGGNGGQGRKGSPDGDGEDAFRFALSNEEFLELFLEDLELPNLAKRKVASVDHQAWTRAGYAVTGSPANLALTRTMRNSLSRRIALKRPRPEAIAALQAEIAALELSGEDEIRLAELRATLESELRRSQRIPYFDPVDVRYRRFDSVPRPAAQAVMFCLMDVSGSMTEHMKDLAKRFYALLYIFLNRRYRHVDVVFIRHTHEAAEVDEDTFFNSPETGGTMVSTALAEMDRVVRERYKPEDWNIYAAQASDGDNTSSDNARTAAILTERILPICQYCAYLEVGADTDAEPIGFTARDSDLWRTYEMVRKSGAALAMRKVRHRRDIYPVFRDLFAKSQGADKAGERV